MYQASPSSNIASYLLDGKVCFKTVLLRRAAPACPQQEETTESLRSHDTCDTPVSRTYVYQTFLQVQLFSTENRFLTGVGSRVSTGILKRSICRC